MPLAEAAFYMINENIHFILYTITVSVCMIFNIFYF